VVPKYGIGMVFWIAGMPGNAVMVKVNTPSAIVAGISRSDSAAPGVRSGGGLCAAMP
jgi:hypothetical protein